MPPPAEASTFTELTCCCTSSHCCRNRACPKCHATQAREWLQERHAELLPCDYFHAVVTVPRELRAAFRRNQNLMYGLLMQVSAAAVKDLCARKRHLGALPGMLSVLHTWNGRLDYHPHVHLLITGGGITRDGQHWKPARGEFLVPVAVLSRMIAAQFRAALESEAPAIFAEVSADVWQREWVSFCKHYGQGNDAVLNYLSRYVFRTAITNARILDMDQTHVTFRWKDRDANAWRTERLPGEEFLRRFLQHVLPRGFHKVRYYGLWHPSKRHQSDRAWLLLMLATAADSAKPLKLTTLSEVLSQLIEPPDRALNETPGHDEELPRCPHCGSYQTRLLGEYAPSGVP